MRKPGNEGKTPKDFDSHWGGLSKEARKVCNILSHIIWLTQFQVVKKQARENNAAAKAGVEQRVFYVLHWILYFLPGGRGKSVPNMRRGEE